MHTIEIYFPQFYFTQVDMEDERCRDQGDQHAGAAMKKCALPDEIAEI